MRQHLSSFFVSQKHCCGISKLNIFRVERLQQIPGYLKRLMLHEMSNP